MAYLKCLKANGENNGVCRVESKAYLGCRMDKCVSTISFPRHLSVERPGRRCRPFPRSRSSAFGRHEVLNHSSGYHGDRMVQPQTRRWW